MTPELIQLIIQFIYIFFRILYICILIRCFLSFTGLPRTNPVVNFVILVTEPILGPTRRLCQNSPLGDGRLDFSPIIAIILLDIAQRLAIYLCAYLLIVFS